MKRKAKKQAHQAPGKAKEAPLSDAMRNRVLTDVVRGIDHAAELAAGMYDLTAKGCNPANVTCSNLIADRQIGQLAHLRNMLKRVLDRETVAAAPGYVGEDMKLIHP